jgi:hypothetical protein
LHQYQAFDCQISIHISNQASHFDFETLDLSMSVGSARDELHNILSEFMSHSC